VREVMRVTVREVMIVQAMSDEGHGERGDEGHCEQGVGRWQGGEPGGEDVGIVLDMRYEAD
jgi:hypothetical protein